MTALSGRRYLFLLWLAVLSALPQLASADEIVDGRTTPVTVRHAMHSCPPGRYVVGVRVDRNELLCSSDFPAPQPSQEYVNGDNEPANQRQGMHACSAGSGVTGLHVANNWLSCAPMSGGVQREVLDGPPPTVRADMHACPSGYALTGIHVGNNQFLCGAPPPAVPDVKVQVTPPQQSVPWGQNATYTIKLSSINGYSNVVQLTATNVPDGSSVTFTPAAIAVPS